jgi:hypothetical protein
MTSDHPHALRFLARLAIALLVLMTLAGVVWHGIKLENAERIWKNVLDRPNGPLSFRFFLQPSVAVIVAIRHGLQDAKYGRAPFLRTILWNPQERGARLREGMNATAKIVLLGLAMDAAYQALVLDMFHPGEAIIVALLLGFVPYFLARGAAKRIADWWALG